MLPRLTSMTLALLGGGLLFPSLSAESTDSAKSTAIQRNVPAIHTEELGPLTHSATIPADADLSTIRFENARLVTVPSRIRYSTDAGYCKELAFRDPGGSVACPNVQMEAPMPAFEVTYSWMGQPLGSDEAGSRDFRFSVYFGLNELSPDVQKALTSRKLNRPDAAAYFAVSAHRDTASRTAIDNQQSHFCEGNYVDGAWVHTQSACQDTVNYRRITAPSDYMTVVVNSTASRVVAAGPAK